MKIPVDIYDYDLFRWIVQMPVETTEEVRLKNVLGKLCHRDLQELDLMVFTDEEKDIMRKQGLGESENIEISGELATLLTGRYVEINVLPLQFSEYYHFMLSKSPNLSKQEILANFIYFGSIPEYAKQQIGCCKMVSYR